MPSKKSNQLLIDIRKKYHKLGLAVNVLTVSCYNPQGSQELNGVRTWGSEDLGLVKVKISPSVHSEETGFWSWKSIL